MLIPSPGDLVIYNPEVFLNSATLYLAGQPALVEETHPRALLTKQLRLIVEHPSKPGATTTVECDFCEILPLET